MTRVGLIGKRSLWVALVVVLVLAAVVARFTITSRAAEQGGDARGIHVALSPLSSAPDTRGAADVRFDQGVLQGTAHVGALPAQPYGSGKFYGVWFVRTDTGDKAFLGALSHDQSIILSSGGGGTVKFAATHFTTGPDHGSPVRQGSSGTNLIIVLIENNVNGLTPSPLGQAAQGTF